MSELGKKICDTLTQLESKRQPHESHWRNCFDIISPGRADGFAGNTDTATSIADKYARLFDSTLADSARILSSSIISGMTPANSLWFGLDVDHENDAERKWMDESAKFIWTNIHASNYDAEGYESVADLVGAGWCVLFIDEDKEHGGYEFEWLPIAQCYLSSSKAGKPADTLYRKYQLTAEQALAFFSRQGDTPSPSLRKLAADKPLEMVDLVHAIYPRKNAKGGPMSRNLPFASCHVELRQKHVARESGYHECPFAAPRWAMLPRSAYGIGPVSVVLPDARTLNEVKRMQLSALDLAIAGMWIAEDDGVLNPKSVKVGPRKIIVANSVDSMKELKSGADFNVAFMAEERLQAQIRKAMMADHLQPQDGPAMTATEVHVRVGLIRQLLGPLFGRLQAEYLNPIVERCFGIAMRAGVLPPAPPTLQQRNYSVRYLSPLARAQKLEDVTAIERTTMYAAQLAQIKGPEVLDNIDSDKAMKIISEAMGADAIMRLDDDRDRIREARADQMQQAQQAQTMQPIIQEAGKAMAQKVAA